MRQKEKTIKIMDCRVVALLLLAMTFAPAFAWFNGNWSFREKITVKASKVNGDLAEFPVYLNLADLPDSFFSTVNGTGADIRIIQGDGISETAFELVSIDTANATGELWFKAPDLSASTDTDFFIYYGNQGAVAYSDSDPYGTHNVWSNGFVAVYHMNQDPSTGITDSTSFNNDATQQGGMLASNLINGKIGSAIEFDGVDDYLDAGAFDDVEGSSELSINLWVIQDSHHTTSYFRKNNNAGFNFQPWSDASQYFSVNGTISRPITDPGSYPLNEWYNTTAVLGSNQLKIYNNGVLSNGSMKTTTVPVDLGTLRIAYSTALTFNGSFDELQFSTDEFSDNWIQSSFVNMDTPGNFYLISNGSGAGFNQSLWLNYHRITIPSFLIDEDLENFPVYVDLSDLPGSFFSTVNGQGADIRITTSDQDTQAPFELVGIDTANGTGELWFKAENLSSSQDNVFYIWYGNTEAEAYSRTDEFGSENVWIDNFTAVYHMNEDPSTSVLDSTTNRNHTSSSGAMSATDLTNGQLYNSIEFDGTDDYLDLGSFDYFQGTQYSTCAWAKTNVINTQIISQRNTADLDSIKAQMDLVGSNLRFITRDDAASFTASATGIENYTDDQWHHFCGTRNGLVINSYANGNFEASDNDSNGTITTDITLIGAFTGGGFTGGYMNGSIDEVKIYNSELSSAWIRAEYINQKDTKNFYYIDNENMINDSLWSADYKITIPAAEVNGDLTDFPVYLNLADLPNDFFSTVNGTGADIRITENGLESLTPFELVDIDTVNGTGELWFQADLSSSVDNIFYLHAGNSSATSYSNGNIFGPQNVWSNNYVAVYHFNDDPTTAIVLDSTRNNLNGASDDITSAGDLVPSPVGKGFFFDGVNDSVDLGTSPKLNPRSFTFSTWYVPETTNTQQYILSSERDCCTTFNGYGLRTRVADQRFQHLIWNGTQTAFLSSSNPEDSIQAGDEYFLSMSIDNTTGAYDYFTNDRLEGSGITAARLGPVASFEMQIGEMGFGDDIYETHGIIDEVHISDIKRSADWTLTEFANQDAAGDFYLIENGNSAGFDPGFWSNSHRITIPHYIIDEKLENFPVYVDLADLPASFFSTVNGQGADIRITTNGLDQQAFELVGIDIVNGTGELWFKAEDLSSSQDNVFYLWYGNPTAQAYSRNDEFGSENVWAEGFLGVWHMNEDPSSGANSVLDSTANRNHASPIDVNNGGVLVDTPLGRGIDFDGIDDALYVGDVFDSVITDANAQFNISVNYGTNGIILSNDTLVAKLADGPFGENQRQFIYRIYNDQPHFFWSGLLTAGSYRGYSSVSTTNGLNQWYRSSVNLDYVQALGSEFSINIDGKDEAYTTPLSAASPANIQDGTTPLAFGAAVNTPATQSNYNLEGVIDEIQISETLRSSAWQRLEYLNQKDTENFYYIDNGNMINDSLWSENYKITIPASEINGDLTDFPVYLNLADIPDSFFSTVNGQGADIRITENDLMTQKAFELVELDTVNGKGELWFKTDLSSSVDNEFYLHAGNPTAQAYSEEHIYGSQNVWSNGFVAVYHLNENGSNSAEAYIDSTANNNDATGTNMNNDSDVRGKFGISQSFNGIYAFIEAPNSSTLTDLQDASYTLSAWHRANSTPPNNSADDREYGIIAKTGFNLGLSYRFTNFYRAGHWITGNVYEFVDPPSTSNIREWHLASSVVDIANGEVTIRVDDQAANVHSWAPGTPTRDYGSQTFKIGAAQDIGGNRWINDGEVDEVRIANKLRTGDWLASEYQNQQSPGGFYLVSNGNVAGFDENLWAHNHKITIPAAVINGDLENFPVYIDLADMPLSFFSRVQTDGRDIRITKPDLTQLAFELVSLDTSNRTGELWFKADQLSSTIDNDFYIWFNNPSAQAYSRVDEFGSENVWTEGYVGVWHLDENGNDISGNFKDSTYLRNNLTGNGMTSSFVGQAKLGSGILIDNGISNYLSTNTHPLNGLSEFNVSVWAETNSFNSLYPRIISSDDDDFDLSFRSNSIFVFSRDFNGSWLSYGATTTDTFYKIDFNQNLSDRDGYLDGESIFNNISNGTASIPGGFNVGIRETTLLEPHDGFVDELRFSNTPRADDWITTEYLNQNDTSAFYLVDNGGLNTSAWSQIFRITVQASQVNGDLTNFPVYIDLSSLPADFFNVVNGTGADIRMTLDDLRTQTAFEIVSIDTNNGQGELWFKAPFLSGTIDTDFYLLAGNPSASAYARDNLFGSENVWSNGFVAVYHMNEDPSSSATIFDSTEFLNHGTANATMLSNDLVNGQIGFAIDFDGSDDAIIVPDSVSLSPTSAFNISLWINSPNLQTGNGVVTKGPPLSDYDYMAYYTGGPTIATYAKNSVGTSETVAQSAPYNDSNWHYSHHQLDASQMQLYFDGNFMNGRPAIIADIRDSANPLRIAQGWSGFTQSTMDEVRVSEKTRSIDWIKTEYNNQFSPNTFYTIEKTTRGNAIMHGRMF